MKNIKFYVILFVIYISKKGKFGYSTIDPTTSVMKFFSKNTKAIFLILIIITLVVGLWYKNRCGKEYTRTEFLLNTQCTITAYGKDAKIAVDAAFDEIGRIHSLTDFYDEASEISKINSAKAGEVISVDKAITDILSVALDVCEASNGAFDITVAPLSALWNFGGTEQTPPDDGLIKQAKAAVGYKNILIDAQKCTVTKAKDETKIDLGGAAKGYSADCAISVMENYDITGAIADLGGNVSCFGKNPKNRNKDWRIGIQVPYAPSGEYGEIITLAKGSVVTSGTYQRNFEYNGTLYHHILSPFTGYPVNHTYDSVTITADSSLLADCLSTACFVLGEKEGRALAEKYNAQISIINRYRG